ncbi:MAG: hypothetical protein CMJ76_08025 [Planctomycetaceae bacterium]|nr:hypothetical protein [Planctomycetaceae bacterium]
MRSSFANQILFAVTSASLLCFCSLKVSAHPVSLTDAVLDIRETTTRLKLSITTEDLVLYYELEANREFRIPRVRIQEVSQQHRLFLETRLQLLNQKGENLEIKYQGIDLSAIPNEGVLQTELKSRWLTYQWTIESGIKPEFLTLSQKFGELQPATMDCMFLQNGFLLEKTKQLSSGQVYTVQLDWKNPPTKRPDLAALKAAKQRQLRDRLGIASYSSLYSFLYISRREVRHEILIPVLTLQQWFGIERVNPDFLSVKEQETVAAQVFELILDNPVQINGESIEPDLVRVNFFGLDIRDFALNKPPQRINIYQARIGIIVSYPARQQLLETMTMRWQSYNKYAPMLRSTVFVQGEKPFGHFFIKDAPTFSFQLQKLKVERLPPIRSGIKAKTLSEVQAKILANQIVERVYSTVNLDSPRDRYRQLADLGVDDYGEEMFLELEKSLRMAEQGGSVMEVHSTDVTALTFRREGSDLQIDMLWDLIGSVQHWGHIHRRKVIFTGTVRLSPVRGQWAIKSFVTTDQKRQPVETRVGY